MNSSEICRLSTTILCLILLLHYSICQPITIEDNNENDMIQKTSADSDSSDELLPNIYFLHSELNKINQPIKSEPTRRANFWKRANFWRKRANFWRRDLTV